MRSAIQEALADDVYRDDSGPIATDDIEARTNAVLGDDGKICRICHGGAEDGRLISPCLCKGSMMYVHVACLQRWRAVGGSRHYFRCDTCHYEYQLRRVSWARWLSKAWVSHALTVLVLLFLVLVAGYVGRLLSALSLEATEHFAVEQSGDTPSSFLAASPFPFNASSEPAVVLTPRPQEPGREEGDLPTPVPEGVELGVAALSTLPAEVAEPSAPDVSAQPATPARLAHPQLLIWQEPESDAFSSKVSWRETWSWSFLSLEHWVAGTTVVGLTSFILFATFPGVIFRGDIGRGGGSNGNLELAIILVIIAVGVVKAFLTLQRVVLRRTRLLVLKAEEHILEVKSASG